MIQLYLKKTRFWLFLGHFGPFSTPKLKISLFPTSPLHKLSNHIWYDYIRRKPIFAIIYVFRPFWAVLGHFQPKNWKFHFFLHHLFKSFPTIYDTTMFEENPFLTIFGPLWPTLAHFSKNLTRWISSPYQPLPPCKISEKSFEPIRR